MGETAGIDQLRPLLAELVAELEHHVPYAAALVTQSQRLSVVSSSRDEQVTESGPTAGAVFTVFDGRHFLERVTDDLTPNGLRQAAREALDLAETRSRPAGGIGPGPTVDIEVLAGPPRHLVYSTPQEVDPATISLEEKLDICRRGRDRAVALDPRVVAAECGYIESRDDRLFVNRHADMAQTLRRVKFRSGIVFSENGVTRRDEIFRSGQGGFELTAIPDSEWEELARRIPGLLKATPLEPGLYDLVVSPPMSGVIAHEVFGHGVETDMFLKGRAKAQEYLGKAVGSSLVDLFDDPAYPGAGGGYAFDDEGQPASKTQILRRGVFVQGLTDAYSAARLGLPRTANGRREGTRKVYPRMTNTYFGPGDDSLEGMIASVDRGVYLGTTLGGMEDPKDWGVQCLVAWARDIEKGRLTDRYHVNLGLTGYVPDLLASVSMVGKDVELMTAGCAKGYKEIITISMGGPHIKMRGRLG